MRRGLGILLGVALLVGLGIVLGTVIGQPLIEERAAEAVSAELGAPATVSIPMDRVPGVLAGHVGDVSVRAPRVERDGVAVEDLRITLDEADVSLTDLLSGGLVLGFDRLRASARIPQEELEALVERRLAAAGVPATVELEIGRGSAVLRSPAGTTTLEAAVAGPTSVAVRATGAGAAGLAPLVGAPIDLAPLPYDVRLQSVRFLPGRLAVAAGRGPGSVDLG